MAVAAAIVAILAFIVSIMTAVYARRQTHASEDQARAAKNADLRERVPRLVWCRSDRGRDRAVCLVPPRADPLRGRVGDARRRGAHPRQQRSGDQPATASTAMATASSTEHCTPSSSPGSATTNPPRPTSPAARRKVRPAARSNAASPATSTAHSKVGPPGLDEP